MRIVLGIVLFLFISFWLMFIIEIGVSAGMKAFYRMNFQNKKEEKEDESI